MDEVKKKETLKEVAQNYESSAIGNIADLQRVSTDLVMDTRSGINDKGETFVYKVAEFEGSWYRVPFTVLKSLKVILEDNPDLKFFKVKKSGVGLDTNYTVIPLA
jgi:hypothetical protein